MRVNEFKLDNIISARNQFCDQRYEIISESLLFEKQQIIHEADKIIKENAKDLKEFNIQHQSININENYIFATANRLTAKASRFEYFFIVERTKIFSQQGQTDNKKEQRKRIALEITVDIYEKQKKLNLFEKQDLLINHIKDRINAEQQQFWSESEHFVNQYEKEILTRENNQVTQDQNSVSVYVIGKKFAVTDFKLYFDNSFKIQDEQLFLCDQYANKDQTNPFYEYNKLHSNTNVANCISNMKMLQQQCPYQDIQRVLQQHFGQLTSFQAFQHLLLVLEHCRQIILWEKLLTKAVDNAVVYESLTQTKIKKKLNNNVSLLQNLLETQYSQLHPRFRDTFYNFEDDQKITEYLNQPILNVSGLPNDLREGHCAYELQTEGIIIYFKMSFSNEKQFSCYSVLQYDKTKPLKGGQLGQLVLADKDEGLEIIKQFRSFMQGIIFGLVKNIEMQQSTIKRIKKQVIQSLSKYYYNNENITENSCNNSEAQDLKSKDKS